MNDSHLSAPQAPEYLQGVGKRICSERESREHYAPWTEATRDSNF
jgi:hypothetical protein